MSKLIEFINELDIGYSLGSSSGFSAPKRPFNRNKNPLAGAEGGSWEPEAHKIFHQLGDKIRAQK